MNDFAAVDVLSSASADPDCRSRSIRRWARYMSSLAASRRFALLCEPMSASWCRCSQRCSAHADRAAARRAPLQSRSTTPLTPLKAKPAADEGLLRGGAASCRPADDARGRPDESALVHPLPQRFLRRHTGHLAPAFIDEQVVAIEVGLKDADRRRGWPTREAVLRSRQPPLRPACDR